LLVAAFFLLASTATLAGKEESWPPRDWLTPAEASGFEATGSYEETIRFLRRLADRWPALRMIDFGTSAQGRPMPAVIVSADSAFTPRAAAETGKAIVMVQSGIHAGEIDGKDASLMILRDLALGRHRELLEGVILLVVPIYNVDGHERNSPYNRPNQNGPVQGMGFRTTTDGHDLNRDHLKLCTPEARALVALFNDWTPHLHVDNHVTNGSDHAWVLTYSWAEAPQIRQPIDAWLKSQMPPVLAATREAGHPVGPYVSLLDRSDPTKGFDSWVGGPRYSTGYFPLRNCPSILIENHAYKPFRDRVLANRDFLLALVDRIAAEPGRLVRAVARARQETVELGRPGADRSEIVLRWAQLPPTETVSWPVYEWYSEPSAALGAPLLRFRRGKIREVEVPWSHRVEPGLAVERPRGYLVPRGWPVIERRLRDHGLRVERLVAPAELEVETMRLSDARHNSRANPSYQGLSPIDVEVSRARERRRFPEGTLWIPADQPDFEVAVQLLEPEAPDSLVHWGLLSIVLERKEYIGAAALEDQVREMLEDPEIAEEWKQALEDETFASDRWARWLWWYRRTPHWDESVGLMPAMRVLASPVFETEPWPGSSGPPPAAGLFGQRDVSM
jgi:hypothetical protein